MGTAELQEHTIVDEKKPPTASGGSAFAILTNERPFKSNYNEMTTLVDNGASEHFLDDELIPGLNDLCWTRMAKLKPMRLGVETRNPTR